jgi:DNA-binding GntR family transcriptional regulator
MSILDSSLPIRTVITDRIYKTLRAHIIDLKLLPGARLRIEHLSRDFDVSPTPVREALNRLAWEGLVVQDPYRGFRVSDLLNHAELEQLIAARQAIEVAAAESATFSKDSPLVTALRELVSEMDTIVASGELDIRAFNNTDHEFHRLIVSASGNRFLLEAWDGLHAHAQIARHYRDKSIDEARLANEEHHEMLASIENNDSVGSSVHIHRHLRRVLDRLSFGLNETKTDAAT